MAVFKKRWLVITYLKGWPMEAVTFYFKRNAKAFAREAREYAMFYNSATQTEVIRYGR